MTTMHVDPKYIHYTVSRSGGPGGQNVNKVNTRVTVWLDLAACDNLTDVQKARVRSKLATRCTREGMLRVVSQKYRTQKANRAAALTRLQELIDQALTRPRRRIPTRISQAAQQRRLDQKKRRSQLKRERTQQNWE